MTTLANFEFVRNDSFPSTKDQYEKIARKVQHIEGYLHGYSDTSLFSQSDLLDDLELEATTSYYYSFDPGSDFTPWLLHTFCSGESQKADLSETVSNSLAIYPSPTGAETSVEVQIAQIAKHIILQVSLLKNANSPTDFLALLCAIDAGLLQIISTIVALRLQLILR